MTDVQQKSHRRLHNKSRTKVYVCHQSKGSWMSPSSLVNWWTKKGGQAMIFGRPFVKRFTLCYLTMICLSCLSVLSVCLSVCDFTVLWTNSWVDQDETLDARRPRTRHIVLDGDPAPPKSGTAPNFRPMSVVANLSRKWGAGCPSNTMWPGPRPTSMPTFILNF